MSFLDRLAQRSTGRAPIAHLRVASRLESPSWAPSGFGPLEAIDAAPQTRPAAAPSRRPSRRDAPASLGRGPSTTQPTTAPPGEGSSVAPPIPFAPAAAEPDDLATPYQPEAAGDESVPEEAAARPDRPDERRGVAPAVPASAPAATLVERPAVIERRRFEAQLEAELAELGVTARHQPLDLVSAQRPARTPRNGRSTARYSEPEGGIRLSGDGEHEREAPGAMPITVHIDRVEVHRPPTAVPPRASPPRRSVHDEYVERRRRRS